MAAECIGAVGAHPGGERTGEQHRLGVRAPRRVLQQAGALGHVDRERLFSQHFAMGQEPDAAGGGRFLQHPVVVVGMTPHRLGQQVGAERRPAVDYVDAGGAGEGTEPCLHAGHQADGAFRNLGVLVGALTEQATGGKHSG